MIPKKIHYFWFGKSNKPEIVLKYIESWKKYFPEYEIIEWNESNFNVNCCEYTKQAYEAKKYAFVSDYARIYVLYNIGGIYFDTDIEVCKSFDDLLKERKMVLGFEDNHYVLTAFMASKSGMECFKYLLDKYQSKSFLMKNGKYDTLPNPVIVTEVIEKCGLVPNGQHQVFDAECEIYPYEYFSAFNIPKQTLMVTEKTYSIHHCMGTWQTKREKFKPWVKSKMITFIGENIFNSIKNKFYKSRKE